MAEDNIVTFKGKKAAIDPSNVPEWLFAYATLISEMKEELRPKNILIIEKSDTGDDTEHNLWIAGPKMQALELMGLIGAVQFMVQHESLCDG